MNLFSLHPLWYGRKELADPSYLSCISNPLPWLPVEFSLSQGKRCFPMTSSWEIKAAFICPYLHVRGLSPKAVFTPIPHSGYPRAIQANMKSSLWAIPVIKGSFPGGTVVKNPPANAGDKRDSGSIVGWEVPLEEEMATHSSILAWRIPWTEDPGGLQSTGSQRVEHDLTAKQQQ